MNDLVALQSNIEKWMSMSPKSPTELKKNESEKRPQADSLFPMASYFISRTPFVASSRVARLNRTRENKHFDGNPIFNRLRPWAIRLRRYSTRDSIRFFSVSGLNKAHFSQTATRPKLSRCLSEWCANQSSATSSAPTRRGSSVSTTSASPSLPGTRHSAPSTPSSSQSSSNPAAEEPSSSSPSTKWAIWAPCPVSQITDLIFDVL